MSRNRYEIEVWSYAHTAEKAEQLNVYLHTIRHSCETRREGYHVVFASDEWTNKDEAYEAALQLEAMMWNEVYSGKKQKGTLAGYWVGTPEVRKVAK